MPDILYFHYSLKQCLAPFLTSSLFLLLSSIYISGHPHFAEPDDNVERTEYYKKHYKFFENGSVYIEYESKPYYVINDVDIAKYVYGMTRFTFGASVDNFCNTTVRISILILMTPMTFFAGLLAKDNYYSHPGTLSAFLAIIYVFNEFFVFFSYFALFTIHVYKDSKYIPYTILFFSVTCGSTVIKLLLSNFLNWSYRKFLFRLFAVFTIIYAYPILAIDIEDYAENVYCDSYSDGKVTILQLIFIFIIVTNIWFDAKISSNYEIKVINIAD
ncbi:unnamed protein product [Caenorhabditis bovis]|uniref:Uncharacterized protein n=1 Tax=Caenorhabditis bovis TaxID=2654633 RepID=A0A8S1ECI4_9PELO|nr:unnamed protein product [Caenorhabditis bovis]